MSLSRMATERTEWPYLAIMVSSGMNGRFKREVILYL